MKLHGLLSLISPPSPNLNVTAKTNYARLKELLKNSTNTPRVLIVGGGETLGYGIENLGKDILKKAINSDICPSPGVDVVADGQFLPFKDSIFDGLIAQAVLYYFQNPLLGVKEIYRVLKPGGYVFVDTPFMHAYLNTPADRVRFTLPGLEKLFSDFQIIHSGISCGPSSALVVFLKRYLALIFSMNSDCLYNIGFIIFGWLFLPLKYLDFLLQRSEKAHEISSGVVLIARKPGAEKMVDI